MSHFSARRRYVALLTVIVATLGLNVARAGVERAPAQTALLVYPASATSKLPVMPDALPPTYEEEERDEIETPVGQVRTIRKRLDEIQNAQRELAEKNAPGSITPPLRSPKRSRPDRRRTRQANGSTTTKTNRSRRRSRRFARSHGRESSGSASSFSRWSASEKSRDSLKPRSIPRAIN